MNERIKLLRKKLNLSQEKLGEKLDINNRVKLIREYFNMNQEQFGKSIGLSKSGISNIENNSRKVNEKHIKLICMEFNVDYHWLATGEGEMFIETDTNYIALIDRIMAGDNEFAKNIFKAFSKFTIEEWDVLKSMIDKILKEQNDNKKT